MFFRNMGLLSPALSSFGEEREKTAGSATCGANEVKLGESFPSPRSGGEGEGFNKKYLRQLQVSRNLFAYRAARGLRIQDRATDCDLLQRFVTTGCQGGINSFLRDCERPD